MATRKLRAAVVPWVLAVAGGVLVTSCTEIRRPFGEYCMRDDDCASGICLGQKCNAPPSYQDAAPITVSDAAREGSTTDASDSGDASEAGQDAATDAGSD